MSVNETMRACWGGCALRTKEQQRGGRAIWSVGRRPSDLSEGSVRALNRLERGEALAVGKPGAKPFWAKRPRGLSPCAVHEARASGLEHRVVESRGEEGHRVGP